MYSKCEKIANDELETGTDKVKLITRNTLKWKNASYGYTYEIMQVCDESVY